MNLPRKPRSGGFNAQKRTRCSAATPRRDGWRLEVGRGGRARGRCALRSPHLAASIQHYLAGFAEDLDSFYPGINALAMLRIQIDLAKAAARNMGRKF